MTSSTPVTCPHCGESFSPSQNIPDAEEPTLILREISAERAQEIREGLNTRSLK